jgi:hypothetical protein
MVTAKVKLFDMKDMVSVSEISQLKYIDAFIIIYSVYVLAIFLADDL